MTEELKPLAEAALKIARTGLSKGVMSKPHFTKTDLREDPLQGAFGLAWYERRPSSLTPGEWTALDKAVSSGRIDAQKYFDWKLNVK